MSKYKIVQKNKYDDYFHREEITFYVKKCYFGFIWFYENLAAHKIDRIFNPIFKWLITITLPICFTPIFALSKLGGIFFISSFVLSYFLVKHIGSLLNRESYSSLENAQAAIITELKRKEFKNKTFDIIEISSDNNKISVQKNNL